jgi:hypothetical protein
MRNPDGIIKPTWNKGVAVTFDFIAHSPETLSNLAVTGWNKVYEFATDSTTTVQTTTTTTTTTGSEPHQARDKSQSAAAVSSIKQ